MVRTLWHCYFLSRYLAGRLPIPHARYRESSFDRDECYRVRYLTLLKEDIKVYLTDGYLIFSRSVAGGGQRRSTPRGEAGDGVILLAVLRRKSGTHLESVNVL